ncbi:hypothetical protein [Candidatus Harpocratesius sp.]
MNKQHRIISSFILLFFFSVNFLSPQSNMYSEITLIDPQGAADPSSITLSHIHLSNTPGSSLINWEITGSLSGSDIAGIYNIFIFDLLNFDSIYDVSNHSDIPTEKNVSVSSYSSSQSNLIQNTIHFTCSISSQDLLVNNSNSLDYSLSSDTNCVANTSWSIYNDSNYVDNILSQDIQLSYDLHQILTINSHYSLSELNLQIYDYSSNAWIGVVPENLILHHPMYKLRVYHGYDLIYEDSSQVLFRPTRNLALDTVKITNNANEPINISLIENGHYQSSGMSWDLETPNTRPTNLNYSSEGLTYLQNEYENHNKVIYTEGYNATAYDYKTQFSEPKVGVQQWTSTWNEPYDYKFDDVGEKTGVVQWGTAANDIFSSYDYKKSDYLQTIDKTGVVQWGTAASSDLSDWTDADSVLSINSEVNNHKNVMVINGDGSPHYIDRFVTQQLNNIFEIFIAKEDITNGTDVHFALREGTTDVVRLLMRWNDLEYRYGGAWNLISSDFLTADNTFTHLKIELDDTNNQFTVTFSGTTYGPYNYNNNSTDGVDDIWFYSSTYNSKKFYIDAIGNVADGYTTSDNKLVAGWLDESGVDCTVSIIDEIQGHNNIIKLEDQSATDKTYISRKFNSQSSGTIEYLWMSTDNSKYGELRIFGSTSLYLYVASGKFYYYDGSSHEITPYLSNTLYFISLTFTATSGWTIKINGISYGPYNYSSGSLLLDYLNKLTFYTHDLSSGYSWYIDALGFSWDGYISSSNYYRYIDDWVDSSGVDCNVSIVNEIDKHKNIIEIDDQNTIYAGIITKSISRSSGIIECWIRITDSTYRGHIELCDGSEADRLIFFTDSGYFKYYDGTYNTITAASSNHWYHISITFDCASTWTVEINGVTYGPYNYQGTPTTFDVFKLFTHASMSGYKFYVDAIGFSWNNYVISNNQIPDSGFGQKFSSKNTGIIEWWQYQSVNASYVYTGNISLYFNTTHINIWNGSDYVFLGSYNMNVWEHYTLIWDNYKISFYRNTQLLNSLNFCATVYCLQFMPLWNGKLWIDAIDYNWSSGFVLHASYNLNYSKDLWCWDAFPSWESNYYQKTVDWGTAEQDIFSNYDYKKSNADQNVDKTGVVQWGTAEDPDLSDFTLYCDTSEVISEKNRHKNVYHIIEGNSTAKRDRLGFNGQTNGTVELFVVETDEWSIIQFINEYGSPVINIIISPTEVRFYYGYGPGVSKYVSHTITTDFPHVKIIFNCSTDTYSAWAEGTSVITDKNFHNNRVATSINAIYFGGYATTYRTNMYFDAIGFSWDGYISNTNRYIIDDWVDSSGVDCNVSIINEISEHKNVMLLNDQSSTNLCQISESFSGQIFGQVEFSFYSVDVIQKAELFKLMNQNSAPSPIIFFESGYLKYYNGTTYSLVPISANQWYHLKIDFDCSTDTYDIYLNNVLIKSEATFVNIATTLNYIQFRTWTTSSEFQVYIDSISFSWDENYFPGISTLENIIEYSLPLSYSISELVFPYSQEICAYNQNNYLVRISDLYDNTLEYQALQENEHEVIFTPNPEVTCYLAYEDQNEKKIDFNYVDTYILQNNEYHLMELPIFTAHQYSNVSFQVFDKENRLINHFTIYISNITLYNITLDVVYIQNNAPEPINITLIENMHYQGRYSFTADSEGSLGSGVDEYVGNISVVDLYQRHFKALKMSNTSFGNYSWGYNTQDLPEKNSWYYYDGIDGRNHVLGHTDSTQHVYSSTFLETTNNITVLSFWIHANQYTCDYYVKGTEGNYIFQGEAKVGSVWEFQMVVFNETSQTYYYYINNELYETNSFYFDDPYPYLLEIVGKPGLNTYIDGLYWGDSVNEALLNYYSYGSQAIFELDNFDNFSSGFVAFWLNNNNNCSVSLNSLSLIFDSDILISDNGSFYSIYSNISDGWNFYSIQFNLTTISIYQNLELIASFEYPVLFVDHITFSTHYEIYLDSVDISTDLANLYRAYYINNTEELWFDADIPFYLFENTSYFINPYSELVAAYTASNFILIRDLYNNLLESTSYSFADNRFEYNPLNLETCFISLADQRSNYLNWENYRIYRNGTALYRNYFNAELGSMWNISIYDRFGYFITSTVYTVQRTSNFINIQLTLHSLKIYNQQEVFNFVNITRDPNYYGTFEYWSEWLAPGEIAEYKLLAGYYVVEIESNENSSSLQLSYTLNGDDILLLSSNNIIANVIQNIANVNSTIGNQITAVNISICNTQTNISNQIINIEINLDNINSTIGNQLLSIEAQLSNLQSDLNTFYSFTNTSLINLNSSIDSQFLSMETSITNINDSISMLVISLSNDLSIVNSSIQNAYVGILTNLALVNNSINSAIANLEQSVFLINNSIYTAVSDLSTTLGLVNNTIMGNLTFYIRENPELTAIYVNTLFSENLTWSWDADAVRAQTDLYTILNNYRNESLEILFRYGDEIKKLQIGAQETINQAILNDGVFYRIKSISSNEYLSDWEPLPSNKTISFGIYEEAYQNEELYVSGITAIDVLWSIMFIAAFAIVFIRNYRKMQNIDIIKYNTSIKSKKVGSSANPVDLIRSRR